MLARAWFIAQVFPLPRGCERQINTSIAWFLWRGDIFRVPMSTLQRRKQQGGWDLLNVAAKCRTLLHFRLQLQSQDHGTSTATWFRAWNLQTQEPNPPQIKRLPAGMEYLRQYVTDKAYIAPQGRSESCKVYKRRIYTTMVVLLRETPEPPEMRVERIWPDTAWIRVWHNLHEAPVAADIKMTWYRAIHDVYPTHVRLHRIHMITSPLCRQCNTDDDLQHRLLECGEGRLMWDWTRNRLARILQTNSRQIPDEWAMRPDFTIWPPKRRRAVLWLLANFVAWRLQQRDRTTRQDYYDFLRRSKWKSQEATRWNERVGNYLSVLMEVPPQGTGPT